MAPRSARSFIKAGLKEGKSLTSLYQASKGTTWAMRKTDFLALGRQVKGVERSRDIIASTPSKYLIGEKAHVAPLRGAIEEAYRYTVKAEMKSSKTGKKTMRWAYINSPDRLSKNDIEEAAIDALGPAQTAYSEELVRFWVITALKE